MAKPFVCSFYSTYQKLTIKKTENKLIIINN